MATVSSAALVLPLLTQGRARGGAVRSNQSARNARCGGVLLCWVVPSQDHIFPSLWSGWQYLPSIWEGFRAAASCSSHSKPDEAI